MILPVLLTRRHASHPPPGVVGPRTSVPFVTWVRLVFTGNPGRGTRDVVPPNTGCPRGKSSTRCLPVPTGGQCGRALSSDANKVDIRQGL